MEMAALSSVLVCLRTLGRMLYGAAQAWESYQDCSAKKGGCSDFLLPKKGGHSGFRLFHFVARILTLPFEMEPGLPMGIEDPDVP